MKRPQPGGVASEAEARGKATADPPSSTLEYRKYRPPWQAEETAEETKGGRGCGGCSMWVVRLLGIGVLVVVASVAGELSAYPAARAATCGV